MKIEIPIWKKYLPGRKLRRIIDNQDATEFDFVRQWVAAFETRKIATLDFKIKLSKLFWDRYEEELPNDFKLSYKIVKGKDSYYFYW
jgi:hypothetical protein